MRDLEGKHHEGNVCSEIVDRQIIVGEADPEIHNRALYRPAYRQPRGATETDTARLSTATKSTFG